MKRVYFICLLLCLTATLVVSRSSPRLTNQTARVAAPITATQSGSKAVQKANPQESQNTETGQETNPGVGENLTTIIQSGSTNTRGYRVAIHKDGSATAEIGGASSIRGSELPRARVSSRNDRHKDVAPPAERDLRCQQNPNRKLSEIRLLRNANPD